MNSICRLAIRMLIPMLILVFATTIQADPAMAKNFITIAIGSVPTASDPLIAEVARKLDAVEGYCSSTSTGAHFGDKLAKVHSLLTVQQPLLGLLDAFVLIARAQCSRNSDTSLLTLYALERNSGTSHRAAVAAVSTRPEALMAKWRSR